MVADWLMTRIHFWKTIPGKKTVLNEICLNRVTTSKSQFSLRREDILIYRLQTVMYFWHSFHKWHFSAKSFFSKKSARYLVCEIIIGNSFFGRTEIFRHQDIHGKHSHLILSSISSNRFRFDFRRALNDNYNCYRTVQTVIAPGHRGLSGPEGQTGPGQDAGRLHGHGAQTLVQAAQQQVALQLEVVRVAPERFPRPGPSFRVLICQTNF